MSKKAKSSGGKAPLPPVLRTKTLERPVGQEVNTDLLRPVNFNQLGCKFVFDKKGILDSNSKLQFAQTVVNSASTAVETNAYCCTSTGALSCVSRAWLTIGGKVISDLRELNHYHTWERAHYSNEYRKGVIMPSQAGMDIFQGSTQRAVIQPNPTVAANPVAIASRGFANPWGVLGRDSSEFSNSIVSATFGMQVTGDTDIAERTERRLSISDSLTPRFSCGLSQLIPFLKNLQLPLFAIEQEVAINIEWADASVGHRFCVPPTDAAGAAIVATNCSSTMVQEACLIMADYLFYGDEMQEVMQQIYQKGGYDISFTDQIVVENNTAFTAATEETKTMQLQLAGKKLKSIVVQKQMVSRVALPVNYIENVGRYNTLAFEAGEEMNLMINAKNFYSRPISNSSLQKTESDLVLNKQLNVCDYRYSNKSNYIGGGGAVPVILQRFTLSDRLVNGYANTLEQGTAHWLGIKIDNSFGEGQRISNIPIEYRETVAFKTAAEERGLSRRYRFFCGIQKILNLSSGLATLIE